ncbi:MAG: enoyl-CoA hydratase [Antricoccus sp.]
MTEDVVLIERSGSVATVTLNRPNARNAINDQLKRELVRAMDELENDTTVNAVILTGADPAFCAGLDLKQLGSTAANLGSAANSGSARETTAEAARYPWPPLTKPVIGAINGVAVTGGFELALNCDILVASERARFADTHARVGVLPGWGLSVLLPLFVGRGLARRMSLTGDFLNADEALRAGLVTQVVAHEQLLPTARQVAETIATNEQDAVRALLGSYRLIEQEQIGDGYTIEAQTGRRWLERGFDPAEVERRRAAIQQRGRTQNR